MKSPPPAQIISHPLQIRTQEGAALIIVLAFVVLLSGLGIAFLTIASSEQQLAHNSFNRTKADQLARSALSIVVGDLKQEIIDGSTSTTTNGVTLYTPALPANIVPQRNGILDSPALIPNLLRRSVRSDPISRPGLGSRASASSSAPVISNPVTTNRGEINPSRWNRHYLIPRPTNTAPNDTTPISAFVAPDWVFVSSQEGPVVLSLPHHSVLGRYAYAVYDEGGLLDVNAAGYPVVPSSTATQFGLKGILSFADLTVAGLSTSAVADLVGWRNYASAQPAGGFGNFVFDATSASRFLDAVLSNTTGFLHPSGVAWNGRTDQMFTSRQMLMAFRASTGFSSNALQNLGTFTRDLNLPTWEPAATQRVSASFIRSDGSVARIGEPLLRRFPLSKLSWIGQTGPNPVSRASDVQRDFGLTWKVDHWAYYGPNGSSPADAIGAIDGTREPDFFQLINFARTTAGLHPSIDEVLSLGASIIDQFDSGLADDPVNIEYAGPPAPSPAPPNPHAYGQEITAPSPPPSPLPIVLNRPFRSPGELGYAHKSSTTTLDFYTAGTVDTVLLDLFTVNPPYMRAGVINLNTRNSVALAAMLAGAIKNNASNTVVSAANARNAASDILSATSSSTGRVAVGRYELGRLTAAVRSGAIGIDEESRELVGRSLAEVSQTRTWNLMIDVIAQSGRFPTTATNLSQFVVEGEKRYWLHIAIDRFTGSVIDQQLEAVYE